MKSLELLAGQDEFRLAPLDESVVLDAPWAVRTCQAGRMH